jgi:hypothetical protein
MVHVIMKAIEKLSSYLMIGLACVTIRVQLAEGYLKPLTKLSLQLNVLVYRFMLGDFS